MLLSACGKKEEKPAAKAPAAAPAAKKAAPAKPAPPDLGLPIERFKLARVTELCATRFGETEEDALILGVNVLLGRPHVPPANARVAPGAVVPGKAADKPAAAAPAPVTPAGIVEDLTPTGRMRPGKEDKKVLDKYLRAISLLPKRPDVAAPIDKASKGCLYAAERGLISDDEAKRYIETFVSIACLQIKLRDAKTGRTDPLAHAQAAGEVFAKNGFSAKSFSELGLLMARFDRVTTEMHTRRRDSCPDPAEAEAVKAVRGRFIGSFKGKLRGTIAFEVKEGGATGEATFTSGKPAKGEPWQLKGAMNPGHLHLFARSGPNDWIRLEGTPGGKVARGKWQGEVGLKKVKGSWTWGRPPPPEPTKPAK